MGGEMKSPLLVLFLAGASLSVAVRIEMARVTANAERIVTLEDRIAKLEADMEACCSTTHGLFPEEEDAHRAYVALKKRVHELEKRVKELEGEK